MEALMEELDQTFSVIAGILFAASIWLAIGVRRIDKQLTRIADALEKANEGN